MVSMKIIYAVAFVAVFAPLCRAAAVTPRETTDIDDDDSFFSSMDQPGASSIWDRIFNWDIFGDFINKFIKETEEQWSHTLSSFDAETCNSPQTGKCQFTAFVLNNENCTIYTIGNCENSIKMTTDLNCQHKCKLPSTSDDSETTDVINNGDNPVSVPAENDENNTDDNIETTS